MSFKDRVAIVTGSGRGIGKDIAVGLAGEGARVAVCDIIKENSDNTAEAITKAGGTAISIHVDVTDESQVQSLVQTVLDRWAKVDILINNAGVFPRCDVIDMPEETWDRPLSVNLKGTFLCSKHVLNNMIENKYGKIVSLTSGIGLTGQRGSAHYAASKAGIIAFTKSLAMEMAPHNIQVNALAPGLTDTAMPRGGRNPKKKLKGLKHSCRER